MAADGRRHIIAIGGGMLVPEGQVPVHLANALRLTGAERIPDAYGALAFLARHPRIDPGQVMLMGFSHGGIATLGSATTWARHRYAPLAGPIFRGFFQRR